MLSGLYPCAGMTSAIPSSMLQRFQITVCQKDEKSEIVIHGKTWTNSLSPASRWLVYLPPIKRFFFLNLQNLAGEFIHYLPSVGRKSAGEQVDHFLCLLVPEQHCANLFSFLNLFSDPWSVHHTGNKMRAKHLLLGSCQTQTFTDPNLPANSKIHGLLKRKINTVTSQHLMTWFFF